MTIWRPAVFFRVLQKIPESKTEHKQCARRALLSGKAERRSIMEKVRFGKTELMVSKVAFGGIPIQRLSTAEAVKVVAGAITLGINFIDTANAYTNSEERIGLAIKAVPRDSIVLASKSLARDKKTFLAHLDLSLQRLGTDYIDIYQHHGVSSADSYKTIMAEGGAFEGMMEAVRAGKVRFPAFSSHSVPLAMEIMKTEQFAAVQLPFNYVDVEAANEAIALAKALDMGFIAMKPFGGGLLHDAKLSMKYLAQFDGIVPDPGIEKLSELKEIISIVESGEGLSAQDEARIEEIKREMGDRWCHRCDYCQPCPQKISISGVLAVESLIKRMPYPVVVAMGQKNMEAAKGCVGCRECVAR